MKINLILMHALSPLWYGKKFPFSSMFYFFLWNECAQYFKLFRDFIVIALAAASCCYSNFHFYRLAENVYAESLQRLQNTLAKYIFFNTYNTEILVLGNKILWKSVYSSAQTARGVTNKSCSHSGFCGKNVKNPIISHWHFSCLYLLLFLFFPWIRIDCLPSICIKQGFLMSSWASLWHSDSV